jgi:hypothetical protein
MNPAGAKMTVRRAGNVISGKWNVPAGSWNQSAGQFIPIGGFHNPSAG